MGEAIQQNERLGEAREDLFPWGERRNFNVKSARWAGCRFWFVVSVLLSSLNRAGAKRAKSASLAVERNGGDGAKWAQRRRAMLNAFSSSRTSCCLAFCSRAC